ncbi:uncharacterized protein M421DRAFT_259287 [Didymella exigua CBS 183.55]|uniref:Uncharacterized protein n=1 Tax=Didymella exigua CBS 183.55 TaxID=1150837 RepID=A0A6A5RCB5_9PLEO|nr:uncharacterized protein M421DRAFT_259287 [Didymella exigua CBS 183.55]KAF1925322.1 hypothetical protein M421DRAFT_259287 [Didymella exigua CBS 183.55]
MLLNRFSIPDTHTDQADYYGQDFSDLLRYCGQAPGRFSIGSFLWLQAYDGGTGDRGCIHQSFRRRGGYRDHDLKWIQTCWVTMVPETRPRGELRRIKQEIVVLPQTENCSVSKAPLHNGGSILTSSRVNSVNSHVYYSHKKTSTHNMAKKQPLVEKARCEATYRPRKGSVSSPSSLPGMYIQASPSF